MSRSAYQFQARIIKHGGRINSYSYRGTTDDSWAMGAILTLNIGGYVASLPTTIDSNITSPVRFVGLDTFAGDATEVVPVQVIEQDTIFAAQVLTSTVTVADIGKRGKLVQDSTTKNYAVDISTAANASIEVVDVEPSVDPQSENADGDYNLVWFKFLPAVLEAAPATPAS